MIEILNHPRLSVLALTALALASALAEPALAASLPPAAAVSPPDGRVRQVIEQSADGGKTWRAWEGLYSRQEKP